jgi:predicted transport protein
VPKSPEEMFAAIARNLPEKTGKGLDEWMEIARDAPEGKKTERIKWLKSKGLGHGQAQTVFHYLDGPSVDYSDQGTLIDGMFGGRNADLKPVYEEVRGVVSKMGEDVDVSARKTYVSFNRSKQFMITLPKKGELVLGLALPGDYHDDRLEPAKNIGGSDRIKWYFGIQDASQLNAYIDLVEAAYEAN